MSLVTNSLPLQTPTLQCRASQAAFLYIFSGLAAITCAIDDVDVFCCYADMRLKHCYFTRFVCWKGAAAQLSESSCSLSLVSFIYLMPWLYVCRVSHLSLFFQRPRDDAAPHRQSATSLLYIPRPSRRRPA